MSKFVLEQDRYKTTVNNRGLMRPWLWLYRDTLGFVDRGTRLDTCRLAWGFIFFIPVFLILALLYLPTKVVIVFVNWYDKRQEQKAAQRAAMTFEEKDRYTKELEARTDKLIARRLRRQRRAERVVMSLSGVWAKVVKGLFVISMLVVLFLVYLVVKAILASSLVSIAHSLLVGGILVLGSFVLAGLFIGFFYLMIEKTDTFKFLSMLFHSLHKHTCAVVEIKED